MSTKLLKFALCLVFLISGIHLSAQVTIGSGIDPKQGALLDLKEKTPTQPDLDNSTSNKGLALPRVNLSEKYNLFPMYLTDPSLPYDASTNPATAGYTSDKTTLDKAYAGLIVYNLVEDDAKELCLGLNQWDGEQWNCFDTKMGNAAFDPVNCSAIIARGEYIEGTTTTSANFLAITLNVTKTGAYNIVATTTNGYSFYLSGVALSIGKMTVNVPCQGTPDAVQTDHLTFSGIDLVSGCDPTIDVKSAVAEYALNCSSIVVNGTYINGTDIASNTITMNVTVSVAGSYYISTPVTNGISFSASGNFTVGTQPVTLVGNGAPTVHVDFPITINANTLSGNATCSTTIPMTLPRMTFAVIGNSTWPTYTWNENSSFGFRFTALKNTANFGTNGTVKIIELTNLWASTSASNAVNYLQGTEYPDIILYYSYLLSPTADLSTALQTYVNNGGCLIFGSNDGVAADTNTLMNGIFGSDMASAAQAQIAGSGTTNDNDYQIANLPNDPVINGPFGNLAGRYWGEDNASTGSIILTKLPANSVQVCSAYNPFGKQTVNPEYSIVWYNDNKNFFYFGDSTGAANNTSQNDYPAYYNSTGIPQSKYYGNYAQPSGSPSQYVYNAALELNAVAWALKKAAVSGINPH